MKRMHFPQRKQQRISRRLSGWKTDKAPDIIYRYRPVEPQGFDYINPAVRVVLGYSPEEIYRCPELLFQAVHPEDRTALETRFHWDGNPEPVVLRWMRKDGSVIWLEHRDVEICDKNGHRIAVEGIARDVSERKRAEKLLQWSEKKFRLLYEDAPLAYLSLGTDGTLLEVNQAWLDLVGYSRNEAVGRWFGDFLTAASAEKLRSSLPVFFQEGKAQREEFELVHCNGGCLSITLDGRTGFEGSGQFPQLHCVLHDITARKRAEGELRDSQRRLADLVNFLPDATFAIDLEGRVILWNQAIEQLTGIKAEDMLGKGDYEYALAFYGERRPILVDMTLRPDDTAKQNYHFFSLGESTLVGEAFMCCIRPSGIDVWVKASPLYNAGGHIIGAIETIRDVSELKQTQAEVRRRLRETEMLNRVLAIAGSSLDSGEVLQAIGAELAATFHASQVGVALLDQESASLTLVAVHNIAGVNGQTGMHIPVTNDPTVQRIFEDATPQALDSDGDLAVMSGAYIERVHTNASSVLLVPVIAREQVIGILSLGALENRHYSPEERELVQKAAQAISQQFENARLYATVQEELEERRAMEEALRESEERYRTLVENQGEGVCVMDPDGRFTFANPAAELVFGVPASTLVGRSLREFVDAQAWSALPLAQDPHGETDKSVFEIDVRVPDGEQRNLIVTVNPRYNLQGDFTGTFAVFRDNTERKRTEEKLRFLSTHDSLTGLYNRSYFEETLARLERSGQFPVSVIVGDVDDLKLVNDTYGHAAGDELLRRAADALREAFRDNDIIARIGGDEFAVLIPSSDAGVARKAIERVRSTLEARNQNRGDLRMGLSIGAATAREATRLEEAVKEADRAMYREKIVRRELLGKTKKRN
jgi:diguanylate cyclase (GGDEF)-like protein/PAS domain S-box-containing protein